MEAVQFEVEPGFDTPPWREDRCAGETLIEELVLDARVKTLSLPCSLNRAWVVEFDDVSVVLHVSDVGGIVEEPGDIVRLEPLTDQFLGPSRSTPDPAPDGRDDLP